MSKNKIFKYLLNIKHDIIKDIHNNDIIYINYNDSQIKCNYLLLFIKSNNTLLWSSDNLYADKYTQKIVGLIKKNIISDSYKNIYTNDEIFNIVKNIKNYKYNNDNDLKNITCEWIIINNLSNHSEYYMITNIISF